ncbi:Z1 domain-containing protein [Mycoplasma struthionis]|nr:Z1 domain-containing protein [Mycoplasma struthionis]
MNKIELIEDLSKINSEKNNNLKIRGFHLQKYREQLTKRDSAENVDFIISNVIQPGFYFKNINCEECDYNKPIKILCLGKVQSGKTSFFLGTISLAFDNGYDLAYVLAGTKLELKKQNLDRIIKSFENNEKIKIFDVTSNFKEDIAKLISSGYKVILVALKNPSENTNLGKIKELTEKYNDIASLIIDDEGDEYTPGAEKRKSKNKNIGKTHNKIIDIITSIKICTFMSVTATPQANLLISTFDSISPDRLVLIKPGSGYTGGRSFFDTDDNPHVIIIKDEEDFKSTVPNSFKKALNFFIFACALKRTQKDLKPFSMLVHPSSFNRVQEKVAEIILNFIEERIKEYLIGENSVVFNDLLDDMKQIFAFYVEQNEVKNLDFEKIKDELNTVISNLFVETVNHKNFNKNILSTEALYKIKVGGNMLGRGLTIERLIVSYIYRDNLESQIDTMYQRCRWFGYKSEYFDVCRVYMTNSLRDKFIAIVKNEEHMWNSMEVFLQNEINLKKFKRLFLIENDKLQLTRKTISKTVVLKEFNFGHRPDESVNLSLEEKQNNRLVYERFINKYSKFGKLVDFDNSEKHNQQHLLIKMSFIEFYKNFLSKIVFAFGSPFDNLTFSPYLNKIQNKLLKDEILVMLMRYKKGEYRSPTNTTNMNLTRLFQGRNDGTKFTGDKYPIDINGVDYTKESFIQIHMVDTKNNPPLFENSIPLISFNCAFDSDFVKLVTGDNNYEE